MVRYAAATLGCFCVDKWVVTTSNKPLFLFFTAILGEKLL